MALNPADSAPPPARAAQAGWERLFGYDVFISFALGPAPRGCRAYASDLARRLRERGFTVFFSEDEAPVGAELDGTLRRALRGSRLLVVVANRGTLAEPRWVRTEVEAYRTARPGGTVVPISVDGALQDATLAASVKDWLPFTGRIWVDETAEACSTGRVSDETVQRLVTAPRAVRSLVRLRIAVGTALAVFAGLAAFATLQRHAAVQERDRAQQALLASSARQAQLLARDGRAHEGWRGLVDALVQANPQVQGPLPDGFLEAALTTLVEDRRGPALAFDPRAPVPPRRDDGDVTPPPSAFAPDGHRVAVAAGTQLAVWAAADGRRLAQATLPFKAEQLTFAGGGTLVVAEGIETPAAGKTGPDLPRAALLDVASGRVTPLPLRQCEQWLPCIGAGGGVAGPRPLSELPAGGIPAGTAYRAAAAGDVRLQGLSGEQFALFTREQADGGPTWWLLDRHSGGTLALKVAMGPAGGGSANEATEYRLATRAPVLVASANHDAAMVVQRIEAGPRLVAPRVLHARLAGATQGVQLDPQGTTLRYQNWRYGTGTGVGQGRTVVMDVASGREQWARGEGAVAWGEPLVALQEYWAETQLLAADTGATWFMAPGQPLGFDPTGRMLLMWDADEGGASASPWPRVRLLEALPVRQFARDAQGPASERSACVPYGQLRFLTLGERRDRLWNRDDWHRVAATGGSGAPVPAPAAAPTAMRWVSLEAQGKRWRLHAEDEGKAPLLDQAQVLHQFPLLAADLRPGQNLDALLTTSPDGRWNAVVSAVDGEDARCQGWARWRLHRGQEAGPVRSGCTTGELPGPGRLPAVSFLPARGGSPMLAALPVDTCRYELLEPESGDVRGAVVPAYGNEVRMERLADDLLAVRSTDWYGGTQAFQLQGLGSARPGPVFMLADRSDGDDEQAGAATKTARARPVTNAPALFEPEMTPEEQRTGIEVSFAPDGRALAIQAQGRTTTLALPPWGERLRERLRQAVRERLAQQGAKAGSAP